MEKLSESPRGRSQESPQANPKRSPGSSRVAGADLKQLDEWLDAVLDAPTYEAVFGSTPKR